MVDGEDAHEDQSQQNHNGGKLKQYINTKLPHEKIYERCLIKNWQICPSKVRNTQVSVKYSMLEEK